MARSTAHLTAASFTGRSANVKNVSCGSVLRVSLFGRVRIEVGRDREPVVIPNRTLPTLAYLLLRRAGATDRRLLSAALWPDDDEASARTRLRSNLHALVHALPAMPGASWLSRDADSIRWNAGAPLWLDVAEFEVSSRDPQRLEEAIALYAGEVAEGLDGEWLTGERERYRQAVLTALETLMVRHRERREFAPAFAAARRLLDID
ncbi:MAG: BTAD domain-containing putative transcriptional regulator, partial [Candidatus Baltobacteraceae bacterium]